jgi:hypothetical protein
MANIMKLATHPVVRQLILFAATIVVQQAGGDGGKGRR